MLGYQSEQVSRGTLVDLTVPLIGRIYMGGQLRQKNRGTRFDSVGGLKLLMCMGIFGLTWCAFDSMRISTSTPLRILNRTLHIGTLLWDLRTWHRKIL